MKILKFTNDILTCVYVHPCEAERRSVPLQLREGSVVDTHACVHVCMSPMLRLSLRYNISGSHEEAADREAAEASV